MFHRTYDRVLIYVSIAGLVEAHNGARSEKDPVASDVELNGVVVGGRVEGVTIDENGGGGNAFPRAKNEEVCALQSDLLEKNGRLETADERLKSALAEVVRLTGELDGNAELLNECQVSGCSELSSF